MGFEVVIVIKALWPKQSLGHYPSPCCWPCSDPPPPFTLAEVSVLRWTQLDQICLNFCHHTHPLLLLHPLFMQSQTLTVKDNGPRTHVWPKTGNKCLFDKSLFPSCSQKATNPLIITCVSGVHFPVKTLDIIVSESFFSLCFPCSLSFLIISMSLLPSWPQLLMAMENNVFFFFTLMDTFLFFYFFFPFFSLRMTR